MPDTPIVLADDLTGQTDSLSVLSDLQANLVDNLGGQSELLTQTLDIGQVNGNVVVADSMLNLAESVYALMPQTGQGSVNAVRLFWKFFHPAGG